MKKLWAQFLMSRLLNRPWITLHLPGWMLLMHEDFLKVRKLFCEAGMGMLQTPDLLLLSGFFISVPTCCCSLICAPMYLSPPCPCDVWPCCCSSMTDDWKTCLKFAEETCMEQAWAWLLCALPWRGDHAWLKLPHRTRGYPRMSSYGHWEALPPSTLGAMPKALLVAPVFCISTSWVFPAIYGISGFTHLCFLQVSVDVSFRDSTATCLCLCVAHLTSGTPGVSSTGSPSAFLGLWDRLFLAKSLCHRKASMDEENILIKQFIPQILKCPCHLYLNISLCLQVYQWLTCPTKPWNFLLPLVCRNFCTIWG